jgi:DNA-binding response OmpR family regulator
VCRRDGADHTVSFAGAQFIIYTRHTPVDTIYQFAPFEVRAGSGELLKDGRRVRLQDQPFRMLVVLLERAGQVVTRD